MNMMKAAIAWVKRGETAHDVLQVIPDTDWKGKGLSYDLFTAYEPKPEYLGRILFDDEGYWIYDGDVLTIAEEEQVARFIINYVDKL